MHEADEREVFFSVLPVGSRDRRLAIIVVILSVLVFGAVAPFARTQLPAVPIFIASYQSALAINDLITAVLLYAQFSILRSRALLLLASGYLFTTAIASVHALTFPGLFAPTGLLNAGSQTTVWLYMFWHGGFPVLVMGYALLRRKEKGSEITGSVRGAIISSVIAVGLAVFTLTLIVSKGHEFLPVLLSEGRYTPTMIGVVSSVWLMSAAALAVLWLRRPHSALDVWLMVVLCAWLFDIALSAIINQARFDLGFYVGRIYGLLAASFVLIMLLIESAAQQMQLSRLLETVRRQRASERDGFRERERLFSAAVESSNDATITKSLDGVITGWNGAAENLFGFSADEAIGKSIDIIVPDGLRSEVRNILDQVRSGIAIKNYETVRTSRDGRAVDISLSVSPVKSQSGQIIGATKIARDISESRKTQLALRQETEERHRIFETSQDLILVTDPKGDFVQVSPSSAPILGYRPEEMIGRSAVEFIHPTTWKAPATRCVRRVGAAACAIS